MYYFRIKQVYTNGYVRYSNIKQLELESSVTAKFSVYPNPSTGIVGIKFDNKMHGHFKIQIYNTQGQVAVEKDIAVTLGSPYLQLATLISGVYWLRVTDKKSLDSGVNQLFIKRPLRWKRMVACKRGLGSGPLSFCTNSTTYVTIPIILSFQYFPKFKLPSVSILMRMPLSYNVTATITLNG